MSKDNRVLSSHIKERNPNWDDREEIERDAIAMGFAVAGVEESYSYNEVKVPSKGEELPKSKIDKKEIRRIGFWPNVYRGLPNSVLRSALFTVNNRTDELKAHNKEVLAVVGDVSIIHTGPILNQSDLDIWEECLHLSGGEFGGEIRFTSNEFLKKIGRSVNSKAYKSLSDSLNNLVATAVTIKIGKIGYTGTLIHHHYYDEKTNINVIVLNPQMAVLFARGQWTPVDVAQNRKLKPSLLAQWIHRNYSTHDSPYPYKIETLRDLSGSRTTEMWKFKQQLKEAIQKVSEVTGWYMEIDEDKLIVNKPEKNKKING